MRLFSFLFFLFIFFFNSFGQNLKNVNFYSIPDCYDIDDNDNLYRLKRNENPDLAFAPYLAKYDSLGNLVWGRFITQNNTISQYLAIKQYNSKIYVFGSFYANSKYKLDITVFDTIGNNIIEKEINTDVNGTIRGLDFDKNGNIAIYFRDSAYYNLENELVGNEKILFLNNSLDSLWTRSTIQKQYQNKVYTIYHNVLFDDKSNISIGTCRYDSTGNILDSAQIEGTSFSCLDKSNNFYFTGMLFKNDTIDIDPKSNKFMLSGESKSVYIAKYDSNFNLKKTAFFYSADGIELSEIKTDKFGRVYVIGSMYNTISFLTDPVATLPKQKGNYNGFLAIYDSSLNFLKAYSLENTFFYKLYVRSNGDLFLNGGIEIINLSIDFDLDTTATLYKSQGINSFFFARYGIKQIAGHESYVEYVNRDMVKNIFKGPASSLPSHLFNWNEQLFFVANDGIHGYELWKSDGTEKGTSIIKDINPNGDAFFTDTFNDEVGDPLFTVYNNYLYFTANDGKHGIELWRTNGTDIGTKMVKDILPNSDKYYNSGGFTRKSELKPYRLFVSNNILFFVACDSLLGNELWAYDEKKDSAYLIRDINPSGNAFPFMDHEYWDSFQFMIEYNNALYFVANNGITDELWRTDGTELGTVSVFKNATNFPISKMKVFDNKLYIISRDFIGNGGIAYYDGVSDILVYLLKGNSIMEIESINKKIVFTEQLTNNFNLWESDGTQSGTKIIAEKKGGYNFVKADSGIYYFGNIDTQNTALFYSNGTNIGTRIIKQVSFIDKPFMIYKNGILFYNGIEGNGYQLWQSNGSTETTNTLRGIHPLGSCNPKYLTISNNILYFQATDGLNGYELWRYKFIKDINVHCENDEHNMITFNADSARLVVNILPEDANDKSVCWNVHDDKGEYEIDNNGILKHKTLKNIIMNESMSILESSSDSIVVETSSKDGSNFNKKTTFFINSVNLKSVSNKSYLKVYPNPVVDQVTIELNDNNIVVDFVIYNSTGQAIFNGHFTEKTVVNTSNFTSGIYLVKLKKAADYEYQKFVKQ